jgi:predicted metalloprotease with PDZ domain
VGRDLGDFDRVRFVADLKAMVQEASRTLGDIPYSHYTFMAIGPGGGGLEHLNSQVITFDGNRLRDPAEYRRTLSFISHEYFHHFNVKRIRPLALGPFDYDRENYTNLLWVSEGFTVYYEDLVLVRDGFHSREEYFGRLSQAIRNFEEIPGHRVQSAEGSSFDTWFGYFGHNEHQENTTISYYDKGLALAVFLDFRIRHETANHRSLDDVMRFLYRTYAKGLGRGFTDAEFRAACEQASGCDLSEIFEDYARTTRDLDYARYFAYAGLEIDTRPVEVPGGWLGADFVERGGRATVVRVDREGPAQEGGLSVEDEILAVAGVRCDAASLGALLRSRRPGDPVKILVARRGRTRELAVTLGLKTERSFKIQPKAAAGALEKAILASWLERH